MKIFRFLLMLIHLGIVSLLLANFLNAYVSPKVFSYLNFIALAFPVLMALNLLMILFWIILWKKRAFFFIIVSLFFIKPTTRIVNYSVDTKDVSNLKVVTFNTKSAVFGREEIEEFINEEDPDIVFLQEAGSPDLIYKFKLSHQVVSQNVFFYSKYEIVSSKEWITDDNAHAKSFDVDINGKIYRFLNIYLEPFYLEKEMVKPTNSTATNERKFKDLIKRMVPAFKSHQGQISLAKDAITNSPYPVIVAGDFNSVPNSYEYYQFREDLQDAFEVVGNGSGTSFHDYKFPIRIDYIFTSKSIQPISYKVDRSKKLSDHFPVVATFKID